MEQAFIAIILGIVEGITEFLPVSSTGHLIVAASFLNFHDDKGKVFEIAIQMGAMLAVVWEYRKKFGRVLMGIGRDSGANKFVTNIIIGFIPLAVLGLTLQKYIKAVLFNPVGVAAASIIGALIIFYVERKEHVPRIKYVDDMTPMDAFKCGLAQSFALFPGMSRSGSSIVGGMFFGLSRKASTEFSFFLGVPTLTAAGFYSLYKSRQLLNAEDIPLFLIGAGVSFVVAMIVIKALLRYVATHSLKPFAWYRIAFGLFILGAWQAGWLKWID
jgi:undecaprenyl-diphosphatase